jgi:hypothetical protein
MFNNLPMCKKINKKLILIIPDIPPHPLDYNAS